MMMLMNLVSFVFVFLIRKALILATSPTLSHAVELSQWESGGVLNDDDKKQFGKFSVEAIHMYNTNEVF